MSTIHGKWSKEDFKRVLRGLDEKTGLKGSSIYILLLDSIGDGKPLGVYADKKPRVFAFSLKYFNDENFTDLAAIQTIRHIYCHYVVDELGLESVFDEYVAAVVHPWPGALYTLVAGN